MRKVTIVGIARSPIANVAACREHNCALRLQWSEKNDSAAWSSTKARTRSVSAHGRAFQAGCLNHFDPRSNHHPPAGKPWRCRTPGNRQGVGFVVRMIRPVVGMVSICILINHRQFAALVLVHMTVLFVGRGWSGMERCRDGCQAMGTRASDRGDDCPEHDHHQNQPSHAQRCHGRAQGR